MHIAVCDDNIADRKQLERLLKRETDKRPGDVCYIDSYGNVEAVMAAPMKYDVFFLDVVSGPVNGYELACRLAKAGVTAPLVLCCSSLDYRAMASASAPSGLLYMDKPIRASELSLMLDKAAFVKSKATPTVELHGEKETLYVRPEEILYAKEDGKYVHIFLRNGYDLKILDQIAVFYSSLSAFDCYLPVSDRLFVNAGCVRDVTFSRLILEDGTALPVSPVRLRSIKKALGPES